MTTPAANTTQNEVPFSETVEAQGHLIDSHIMERIFDTVVEFGGRFEVEHFSIGRTNSDPSRLRLRIEAPNEDSLGKMMTQLLGLGCAPVDSGEAELRVADKDRCAPEDFYSTTNQRTQVRVGGQWIEAANQRMDAMIVVGKGTAACRRLRDVKAGDQIVVGMKGIRVIPEAKERDRQQFAFMSNDISSERQVETAVGQTAAMMQQMRRDGKKIIAVAGPVVVHTGGAEPLSRLIRHGWIDAVLAGNALAAAAKHDLAAFASSSTSTTIPQIAEYACPRICDRRPHEIWITLSQIKGHRLLDPLPTLRMGSSWSAALGYRGYPRAAG